MKKLLLFFVATGLALSSVVVAQQQPPEGCSVISFSKGDSVFFAGNDDFINPDSYYFVEPGDSTRYGVIWIGKPDNPQQGVNEKGPAFWLPAVIILGPVALIFRYLVKRSSRRLPVTVGKKQRGASVIVA